MSALPVAGILDERQLLGWFNRLTIQMEELETEGIQFPAWLIASAGSVLVALKENPRIRRDLRALAISGTWALCRLLPPELLARLEEPLSGRVPEGVGPEDP